MLARHVMVAAALAALGLLALAAGPAVGKGVRVALAVSDPTPAAGERVVVSLRGTPEVPLPPGACRVMRIVAVAPGVPVRRALRSLEGGRVSRPVGRWGAFRLASLRRVGEWRWRAVLRPGRPGRWVLVVPNICADGYMLPEGLRQAALVVR